MGERMARVGHPHKRIPVQSFAYTRPLDRLPVCL